MKNNNSKWALFLGAWLAIAGVLTSTLPSRVTFAAGDSRIFPETGKTASGRFLNYWNSHGSLPQQGYPITEEVQEQSDTDGKVYTMQYFERAVFEFHPEFAGTSSEVLLSLLGTFYYNEKYHGSAPAQHTNTDNPRLFNETGFTVGGAFRQYWETHGGLAQQGYPISEEFTEIDKDGNPRTVQYFQRAVFELHPENKPPSNVLLSLLGVFYFDKQHGGVGAPTPTTKPGAPPNPAPTNAPAPVDSSGQVIFYNSTAGHAEVGHVDASGNYTDLKPALTSGSPGWTHIVALGGRRLLWYNKVTGRAVIGQVASDGTYSDIAVSNTLGGGWTQIVSASEGIIFFYNGSHAGGTARVNGDGTIDVLKTYTTFSSGWTNIVGLSNGIYFFYERGTGRAATLRVDSDGVVVSLQAYTTLQTVWTNVVAGSNGTILFYNYIDGRAVAGKVDTDGIYTDGQAYPDSQGNPPLPNPYPIVAGLSNGTLLFYNDSQRSAVTARMSGDGSIPIYNTIPAGTFQVWTHIVGIK
jgi:hypothetical protein